jgi:hypothetical protein
MSVRISVWGIYLFQKKCEDPAVAGAEVGTQILTDSDRYSGSTVQTPRKGDYPILCSRFLSEERFVPETVHTSSVRSAWKEFEHALSKERTISRKKLRNVCITEHFSLVYRLSQKL